MPFFETWSHPCIIAGTILVRSVSLPLYSVQLHVMHSMWVKLVCPEMFYTLSISSHLVNEASLIIGATMLSVTG